MAESFTGLVLGMQQMDVNPPAAAARDPLSMVSACSNPGSRRCTCISMKPGATIIPVASNTSAFGEERFGATPAIRPSTISTSATRSVFEDGSITLPFLDRKSTRLNSSHLGISYAVFCLKKKTQQETVQNQRCVKPLALPICGRFVPL